MIASRFITKALLTALLMSDATRVAETAAPNVRQETAQYPPAEGPHLVPGGLFRSVLIIPMPFEVMRPRGNLDGIAQAVEGAESSYGRDPAMWRPDLRGPQGPMQISEAAAIDVGGGNRFDIGENRVLGRAYLTRMYARYGNWQDALLAYNWGPGNLDQWIGAGRPADWIDAGLSNYVARVLNESLSRDEMLDSAPASSAVNLPASPSTSSPTAADPEVPEATIGDPRLRKMVAGNNRMIIQLRSLLDAMTRGARDGDFAEPTLSWLASEGIEPAKLAAADAEAVRRLREVTAKIVLAISNAIARRPGDENFKPLNSAQRAPDMDQLRLVAELLKSKLQEENSVLALVDKHKRADTGRRSPTTVE